MSSKNKGLQIFDEGTIGAVPLGELCQFLAEDDFLPFA
jgi:hypothetical protein|tara:strand:- start:4494 stop:4607 length:114 start_codon:yes stop_codon:yes gene_type:complete